MTDPHPRLSALRRATDAQHQALHVHPLLAPLSSDSMTREDYYWALRAFHAAYTISEAQPRPAFASDTPVLAWLKQDMQHHGLNGERVDFPYPACDTPSKQLGYLYVKQGSTLGGRVITKHLSRALGLEDGIGNHFFAGHGDATGAQWKQFTAILESAPDIVMEEMTAQAVAMFRLIAQCCDHYWRQHQSMAG